MSLSAIDRRLNRIADDTKNESRTIYSIQVKINGDPGPWSNYRAPYRYLNEARREFERLALYEAQETGFTYRVAKFNWAGVAEMPLETNEEKDGRGRAW